MVKRVLLVLAVLLLPVAAQATVTSTDSTVTYTCTDSTGPFAFTFPALDATSLRVIEILPGAPPGVMTVLASDQWTSTPVNNSYANGGSVTLISPCPTGDTLVIARATDLTQLTHYTPYMPALYANFESNLDQLTTGRQDAFRATQVYIGASGGSPSVTHTPLGQYINLPASGGSPSGVSQIIAGTNITISPTGGTGAVTINSTQGCTPGSSGFLILSTGTNGQCGNSDLQYTFDGTDASVLTTPVNGGNGLTIQIPQNGLITVQGAGSGDEQGHWNFNNEINAASVSYVDEVTDASIYILGTNEERCLTVVPDNGTPVSGITLPDANGATSASPLVQGVSFCIFNNQDASLVVTPNGSDTINGSNSAITIPAFGAISLENLNVSLTPHYAWAVIGTSYSTGVSSFSGDGTLLNNSASTGAVTATLASAGAHKYWGNDTGSTATPAYYQPAFTDLSGNLGTTQGPSSLTGLLYDTTGTLSVVTPLEFGQASSDASANMTLDTTRTSAINASDVFQSILVGDGAGHALGTGATGDDVGPNTLVGYRAGYSSDFGVDNVFIGDSSGYNFNGPENSDPADGNNTCVGSTSCYGDKTMYETIALGQKAYVDTNANAAGGSADNIFIGIHSDNWDGGSDNILEGYAITRYTGSSSALVTGTGNVLLGTGILSCPACGSISSPITNNYDIYIGYAAGDTAFNSAYGIGIGYNALSNFQGGSSTAAAVAVGHAALQALTTGVSDAAFGEFAATSATTGDAISAFGFDACLSVTTANGCTAFGDSAGKNTTGAITAFGYLSGYSSTGANNDTFGNTAGYGITTGTSNVSIGDNSLDHAGSASDNVVIGYDAAYYDTSSSNVYIGYLAGGNSSTNVTLGSNVGIGGSALNTSTSANEYDTAIGRGASCAGCTSSEMIGYEADVGDVAGAAQIGTGTNSTADTMQFQTLPIASLASFSVSGCGTAGSLTGSGLTGTFTAGATSCTPVITTGVTAPHGYVCDIHDRASPTTVFAFESSSTTTTVTFPELTVTDGDTMAFRCSSN